MRKQIGRRLGPSSELYARYERQVLVQSADNYVGDLSAIAGDAPFDLALNDPELAKDLRNACVDLSLTTNDLLELFEAVSADVPAVSSGRYMSDPRVIEEMIGIADPQSSDSVLEPGCGAGGFLEALLNIGDASPERMAGFDISRALLGVLKKRIDLTKRRSRAIPTIQQMNVFDSDTVDDSYSLIIGSPPWVLRPDWPASFRNQIEASQGNLNLQPMFEDIPVDMAMMFLAHTLRRFLAPGCRLVVSLPSSAATSQSWESFRSFQWVPRNWHEEPQIAFVAPSKAVQNTYPVEHVYLVGSRAL
jgi:SAM-dependent methyltransferase